MTKKRKSPQKASRNAQRRIAAETLNQPTESRAAVAATVFWMLATLVTAGFQLVSLCAFAWKELGGSEAAETVGALGAIAAVITGIVALCSAAVALRISTVRPPKLVVWPALLIATAPLVHLLLRLVAK